VVIKLKRMTDTLAPDLKRCAFVVCDRAVVMANPVVVDGLIELLTIVT